MSTPPLPAATVTDDLWQLLDRHAQLQADWKRTRHETDRLAMAQSWGIFITHPGGGYSDVASPGRWKACTPTVLSRDTGNRDAHLAYRGACLGCGWVSPNRHLIGQGGENAAVEDAHDHTHPGWRDLLVIQPPPSCDAPSAHARALASWREQWEHLLPTGWLDHGGPIRTARLARGTRHVPGRAPGGGYDLSAGDATAEQPGGQLGLF
jgi:hypothetical protein